MIGLKNETDIILVQLRPFAIVELMYRLIEKMNDGDAGVKVVMDIIENTRRLGAYRDQMRILADSLVVLAG